MLFNSYEFIFAFLPIAVAGFFLLGQLKSRRAAIIWLVAMSLFFYGWWNPAYLVLLLASVIGNYLLGYFLSRSCKSRNFVRKLALLVGIVANLANIGYYKYFNFFADNLNAISDTQITLTHIVLPLAISFFTFQQITFLVDSYKGVTIEHNFLHYCLFVTFFPQLIAGPIVHHSEMLPQFARNGIFKFRSSNLAVGLTIFSIGLFKKAVLADGIAVHATPVFAMADGGASVDFFTAWGGALAYTLQLYFDFSGYSDMALGGARLFGIRLPANFNSPYQATNIAEFWRRWHMTLSRFLRDYVYIALGGNRHGTARRLCNLMLTMLLGGLWHGAGWTFIVWGGLHGLYLVIHQTWSKLRQRLRPDPAPNSGWFSRRCAQALTLLAVIVGWVFFRATTFDGALRMLEGMVGANGISLPSAVGYRIGALAPALQEIGIEFSAGGGRVFLATWCWIAVLGFISLCAPNSLVLLRRYRPALNFRFDSKPLTKTFAHSFTQLSWRPNLLWVCTTSLLACLGILAIPQVSEFLYYQF